MQKTTIQINKIELDNFQPKTGIANIKVIFQKNNQVNTISNELKIKDPYNLVRKLLIKVKSTGKFIVETESDDILENIFITELINEEETEEQMLNFFKGLCQKIQILRATKIAKDYMKLINQIKTTKLEI